MPAGRVAGQELLGLCLWLPSGEGHVKSWVFLCLIFPMAGYMAFLNSYPYPTPNPPFTVSEMEKLNRFF